MAQQPCLPLSERWSGGRAPWRVRHHRQVVEYVSNFTDRPLLDKTGLTGFYDIQTEGWASMNVKPPSPDGAPQSGDASINNPDRPTLFNVFEKLGLRMESQRAVIDMFVIDHVERPSVLS